MTPSDKRRLADQLDSMALKLEGQARSNREAAGKLRESADADEADTGTVLHKRLRRASVNVNMHTDHRVAISRSRKGDEAFLESIGRYTQNELAKAVGISPATLSFYRNGRKIPRKTAEDIERLTGWKATGKNWPGGIKDTE